MMRWQWMLLLVAGYLAIALSVSAEAELKLELNAPWTEYLIAEPLYLTVTVSNEGTEEIETLRLLNQDLGLLKFEITAPGEEPHLHRHWMNADMFRSGYEAAVICLGPGDKYSATADLGYEMIKVEKRESRMAMVLSKPGEYVFRANYKISERLPTGPIDLWSNEIRLIVKEPEGVDAQAYEILQSVPLNNDIHRVPWFTYKEHKTYFKRLLDEAPQSKYAPYATFYLAHNMHDDGLEKMRGTPEGRDVLVEAAKLYLTAAKTADDPLFGIYATRIAARTFAQAGDSQKAIELLKEAFLAPVATDSDRQEIISWLMHVESGYFYESSRLGSRQEGAVPVNLPLRLFAQAMGMSMSWDSTSKLVTIDSSQMQANFHPGEDVMMVNDIQIHGVKTATKAGQVYVCPSTFMVLMYARYSKDLDKSLSFLLELTPDGKGKSIKKL